MGLLQVGASALKAATLQIQTTGNNVANATTPGYHRQVAMQEDNAYQRTGSGYVGMGVVVDTIQRRYNAFLEKAVGIGEASAAADKARFSQMSALENLFTDSESGLGSSMNDLRTALGDLVSSPADSATRTVVLNRAEALAQRLNALEGQLSRLGADNAQRMDAEVKALNSALGELARVNQQIGAADSEHLPNHLLDQRDQLISQINGYSRANAYFNDDQTVSLFTVTGEPMVLNGDASTFSLTKDAFNSGLPQLNLTTLGKEIAMDAAALGGGSIAGLIRFQGDDLASAQARLGQMAIAVGQVFNDVQANGVDGTGLAGKPMFSWADPQALSAATNLGNAELAVTVADPSAVEASDYLVVYDGSQFIAERKSDGKKTTLGAMPQTLDGLTIDLDSGTAQTGDRFLIRSASNFASTFKANLGSTSELAVGLAVTPQLGTTNAGSLAVAGFKVTDAGDANLTAPVTLVFDGAGNFDVVGPGTGNPTGVAYTTGTEINFNGWSMTVNGSPAAGDSITLGATAAPSADNRNARALYEAVDLAAVNGRSFGDAYADLVADVGTRAHQAKLADGQSSSLLATAKAARDSESGVNLDEEAARLLQFQQAYQAAAKLISTSQSMFSSILDAVN